MRKVLLIGCPGGGLRNKFLHGVQSDYENTTAYLSSPRGGSFNKEEIMRVHNPTARELGKIIRETNVDYASIFFFGHGHTDRYTNERIISLRDYDVPDTYLLTKSRIQTISVDACRDLVPGIAGIPQYVDPYSSFDGVSEARSLFDEFIANANGGSLIMHGTQSGEPAWEQGGGAGGAFTTSLLQIASTLPVDDVNMPYYLDQLLPHVAEELKRIGHPDQIPCIVHQTDGFNMPFMISAPQILSERPKNFRPPQRRGNVVPSPIVKFAAGVFLTVCIASLFDK